MVRPSISRYRWSLRLDVQGERRAEELAAALGLDPIAARVLAGRGVTAETAEGFLNPMLARDLPDPSTLQGMDDAVARLVQAVQRRERIAVFGDYDVDGATSSALIARYLTAVTDAPFEVYIPNRRSEGYGPNAPALLALRERGAAVLLTVDCGTLAFAPLQAAAQAGLDVIVCDHHQAESRLPQACAVINPNRRDETTPHKNLAAVGVTFLLIVGLNRALRESGWFRTRPEPKLMHLVDLVALGTVADVVELTGLNRTFVAQGLKVMAMRKNAGIRALMEISRIGEEVSTYHLGFLLGPRVNADGRVGAGNLGWQLLATDDEETARRLAETLDACNTERQNVEAKVQAEAMTQAAAAVESGEQTLLVTVGEEWHAGVIGIVAGRLREKFDLPAFVFSVDDDGIARGSARSIPGVDIGATVLEALRRRLLTAGGGHPMAAGLTLPRMELPRLKEFLADALREPVTAAIQARTLQLDGLLDAGQATVELASQLARIGPFGAGNPAPRFAVRNLLVMQCDIVGTDHVRMVFQGADGGYLRGIAFRSADGPLGQALLAGRGKRFDVAGRIKLDEWQGVERVDLVVEDLAMV